MLNMHNTHVVEGSLQVQILRSENRYFYVSKYGDLKEDLIVSLSVHIGMFISYSVSIRFILTMTSFKTVRKQ